MEKLVYVSESFSSIVMEEMMTGARRVLSWSSSAGSCKGAGRTLLTLQGCLTFRHCLLWRDVA